MCEDDRLNEYVNAWFEDIPGTHTGIKHYDSDFDCFFEIVVYYDKDDKEEVVLQPHYPFNELMFNESIKHLIDDDDNMPF